MSDVPPAPVPPWLKPHGRGWTAGPPVRVHDNPYFAVDAYDAVAPTGHAAAYYVHHHKNLAVGVVPLHPDGTVSLIGQWRFPFGVYSWELPEGGVPRDEDALHGAQRELAEEAGLTAARWRRILTLQMSNSSCDERAVCYLATDFTPAPLDPDPTEALTCVRVPFGEVLAAIAAGQIEDAITVAAVLRVHHMAISGELAPDLAQSVLSLVPAARSGQS